MQNLPPDTTRSSWATAAFGTLPELRDAIPQRARRPASIGCYVEIHTSVLGIHSHPRTFHGLRLVAGQRDVCDKVVCHVRSSLRAIVLNDERFANKSFVIENKCWCLSHLGLSFGKSNSEGRCASNGVDVDVIITVHCKQCLEYSLRRLSFVLRHETRADGWVTPAVRRGNDHFLACFASSANNERPLYLCKYEVVSNF
jgi:hypothetical protein